MNSVQSASAENLNRRLPDFQAAARALRDRPAFGWIKALRTALKISVTVLAKRLNVSHSTVLSFEQGELTGRT